MADFNLEAVEKLRRTISYLRGDPRRRPPDEVLARTVMEATDSLVAERNRLNETVAQLPPKGSQHDF